MNGALTDQQVAAYYAGRNSIGDEGEVWFTIEQAPEFNNSECKPHFLRGIRSIKAELRLNADTEWD